MRKHMLVGVLLGATILPALQGCVTAVVAGATAGALATMDRRSLGTQTEDETIEWKASARVSEKLGDTAHINYTSYDRKVLLTGEVNSAEDKAEAERIVSQVPNVAAVLNELAVGPVSSFSDRNPVHIKVVTEAGVVYLMGLVTQPEADAAIKVARTTGGVKKVVNLFDIITPAKARELDIAQSKNGQPTEEKKP